MANETIRSNENSVIATFNTHDQAEKAVRELQKSSFDMQKLSILGKGYHSEEQPIGFYTRGDRMKTWGATGAFWGGVWGLLVGAAFSGYPELVPWRWRAPSSTSWQEPWKAPPWSAA